MLIALFATLAPALTLLLYFMAMTERSPLWMLPIAIGFFAAFCLLYVFFLLVSGLLLKNKEAPERYMPYAKRVLLLTVDWFLTLCGFRIRVKGKELLPDEPFVLVSNHRSAMDPLVYLHAFSGHELSFVSKASVMRWPIVGPYMVQSGFLAIERDKPLQSLRVIRRAARLVTEGISFGIFPEGTRTKNGLVGEFKEGAFLAAKRAEAPLVIATIEGTEKFRKRLFPRVVVTVRQAVDRDTVKATTHEALSDLSHSVIKEALGEK